MVWELAVTPRVGGLAVDELPNGVADEVPNGQFSPGIIGVPGTDAVPCASPGDTAAGPAALTTPCANRSTNAERTRVSEDFIVSLSYCPISDFRLTDSSGQSAL